VCNASSSLPLTRVEWEKNSNGTITTINTESNTEKYSGSSTNTIFGVLTPLSTIFQLYHGNQFLWWKKPKYPERTTDRGQATGKPYYLLLRVECTLFVMVLEKVI
jgi:hypothetical protein